MFASILLEGNFMTNTVISTNYLVYTADLWQSKGSFRIRGVLNDKNMAEGLKKTLIKNNVDDAEHIHILPVEANECCMDGGYLL